MYLRLSLSSKRFLINIHWVDRSISVRDIWAVNKLARFTYVAASGAPSLFSSQKHTKSIVQADTNTQIIRQKLQVPLLCDQGRPLDVISQQIPVEQN